jgi:hypothetical protein
VPGDGSVRIAELVATLSYAADLGLGRPMAHSMRQTVIALRLASLAGATDYELEATYYLGLMMNVYCHADAAEQAGWFGDDISFKGDGVEILDMSTARTIAFILRRVGSHGSGLARAKRLAAFPAAGPALVVTFLTTHSTLGAQFAGRSGLDEAVSRAIQQAYEQWDGKGQPAHLRGEEICLPTRLVQLASPVEVFSRRHGTGAAQSMARKHRGTQFDPAVVDLFCDHAADLLDGLDLAGDWDAVLDAEPRLSRRVSGGALDEVLEAMADLVDLKALTWPATHAGSRTWPARRPGSADCRSVTWWRCAGRGSSTIWAGSVSPIRCGTSQARSPGPRPNGPGCIRT